MTTKQENINNSILRTLEVLCAIFFAFLGSGALVLTVKSALHFIGELMWRLPKGGGYLHLDILLMMGLFIISTAMFSALFLIVANAFWGGRWSRRIILSVIFLAIAGFCTFMVSMMMLGAGLSQMS